MTQTSTHAGGMVTAPHHQAAEAGAAVLREGGTAVEAMVAAAAVIAVVYPHMNALGGDGFWLIDTPGREPVGIDADGPAAAAATPSLYRDHGLDAIPPRGPLAALTVPGTVAGWADALTVAPSTHPLPLSRLLAPAIESARRGAPVTASQADLTTAGLTQLRGLPGFDDRFLVNGDAPAPGTRLPNPALADTLEQLARAGLADFHRGEIATALAADLQAMGSPLTRPDLAGYAPRRVEPLSLSLSVGHVFNLPPPTQGLASLLILGLYDRLGVRSADGFDHVHGLVEATKAAFTVRDAHVTDPRYMTTDPAAFLAPGWLDSAAAALPLRQATPWPRAATPGDTVWLGAVDNTGRAVSFIQSIYWEFGAGVVSPATGVLMQNRGLGFSLDADGRHPLAPGRRPFHTLNPALARLADGRTLVYGTMGGEGQPQTQAAVFTRYAYHDQPLQTAVTAPRWLLGRTWGDESTDLKLEDRFPDALIADLRAAGHELRRVEPFSTLMGHAGGIARYPDGRLEGAFDPRSDGAVAVA